MEVFHLQDCIVQKSTVLKSVLNTLQIFMTKSLMPLVYNLQVSLKFCLKTNEASQKASSFSENIFILLQDL